MPRPRIPVPLLEARNSRAVKYPDSYWVQRSDPDMPLIESVEGIEPPAILSDHAREEWMRIVPVLAAAKILAETDLAILTAYCCIWSDFVEIVEFEKDLSMLDKLKTRSLLSYKAEVIRLLNIYAGLLGLSPSTRSKVHVIENGSSGSSKERFFE